VQCCNIYDSYTLFQDGFNYELARLLEGKIMLQKLKVTSYALIYFLMVGFSFIALQVTAEEVEAAGVCEPVDRIKQRNNADSRLWFQRCAQSGSKNTCGNMAEWPRGDGGRCVSAGMPPMGQPGMDPGMGAPDDMHRGPGMPPPGPGMPIPMGQTSRGGDPRGIMPPPGPGNASNGTTWNGPWYGSPRYASWSRNDSTRPGEARAGRTV
jgi:hypothetical protein